ncbi:MAG: two-component system response regulator [Burkholderiales bacterium RIFCSPLOWO2_12_FULL_64_99]|jgi:CheY-like chemotaxis protein|uniref:response regulator n=1 Tax=Aquabacterium sp. TaxID=1872578 RepID=UPI0008C906FB|nr:response regulator [Aquabacterium sp.]OGB05860.1 MAG: two-component system response regulator [Burkholderiales bacterium RIFCSPHIGHO2_12_FULL_63_20]OGB61604.1 MAG: two-component system response regulator [Burkholderiales bacterium RIFCSPLOWO2_12_FULL_64_99]
MSHHILLIEDNEQNSYLVSYLLQARGWTIAHAADGPTGLALADQAVPDLVLLDIQLPGMDGHEVARRLRTNPKLTQVPIVAVTSYAMQGDRERCMASGCNGYIEKPIDPDTFAGQVEQFLGTPS